MDVTFISANPKTLVSCFSLSSFSYSNFSSNFYLRVSPGREFLSPGASLPSTCLRSRRRCRILGFNWRAPKFLVRASFDGESVFPAIAVAATNLAALRLIYLNYTKKMKKDSEFSSLPGFDVQNKLAVPELDRGIIKHGKTESQVGGFGELNIEIPMERKKFGETGEGMCCNNDPSTDISALNSLSALITGALETTHVLGTDFPSMKVGKEGSPEPEQVGSDIPEFIVGGGEEEVLVDPEMPSLNGSLVSFKDKSTNINQDIGLTHESQLQVSSYIGLSTFVREELYTLYEDKQSESISAFQGTRPQQAVDDLSLLATISSSHRHGSASKMKDSIKANKFSKERRLRHKSDNKDLSRHLLLNGTPAIAKSNSSNLLRTYNCLLRDERLVECLELLENMEREALLDMDQVYHARFFNTCKSQKAVNEAFRFARLIKKPTLSTFNMLLSVCANAQDFEGAFQVQLLVKGAGLKADCKLYTTLISTCAKSEKVDAMFEVFHEMVNAGIEPNVHTYGALIDGCARAGQVAKAFGAYGIMRSKKVKPDRVIFNALITACGRAGAIDRAFDVLSEMRAEPTPIDPDHVTVGALMKTCTQAGQVDRAMEVYKMIHQYNIKGTADVYTIAVNSCSETGDLDFALNVYNNMKRNEVVPDEMFLSALIDAAGHAGKIEIAFEILQNARIQGAQLGNISYSSLMGACSNSKNWQRALELYKDIKNMKLVPTVATVNALINSLCDGDQLKKSVEVLAEVKEAGVCPNEITYSILVVACEKKDDLEIALKLFTEAKKDGIVPNLIMFKCLMGLCLRRFKKAYSLGESILSFSSGKPQLDNQWTMSALMVYREAIAAGNVPSAEFFSQVLGCLKLPHDTSLRNRLVENLGVSSEASSCPNIYSLLDGFGEYDPRSFSLLEEAASLGIVPCVSFKESPIILDARKLQIYTSEVYLLTILKGLKHRLAAGARLPNITILLLVEKTQVGFSKGNKTVNLAGRVGQSMSAMLRRLGLHYQGKESLGKIRINGLTLKRWFQPKLSSQFGGKQPESSLLRTGLAKGITDQQRNIRTSNLSFD